MASLLTNASAMTALQTLTQTNKDMQTTQARISTGLRVGQASDNAAYWSISTTMKSDNMALSTVKDALNLGSATIDVASAALTATKDVVDQIKSKLVAASEPGIDRAKGADGNRRIAEAIAEHLGLGCVFWTKLAVSRFRGDELQCQQECGRFIHARHRRRGQDQHN